MAATLDRQEEQVFEGRGVALHVAPEGLAITGSHIADGGVQAAEWPEVAAVRVLGGRRTTLVVELGAARPAWTVAGMRYSHAEWARRAIEAGIRRVARQSQAVYLRRLAPAEVTEQVNALLESAPVDVPELALMLLTQAALTQASDVHLVPEAAGMEVRWRVDGLVRPVCRLPQDVGARLVAHLKTAAGLASYYHDVIQEGHVALTLDRPVDLRLTVLPSLHGETATVRLFDPARGLMTLDELGFEPDDLTDYRTALASPGGLIVLTGPAGAGKTTTMYASMHYLHEQSQGATRLATVEDPVERDLGFATQTGVRTETGISFAAALKTILRQDPDVIMVGEVRDAETAEIAVRAGMTGHLIFTTLHAGGSGGVFPRLAELGIAPFLSSSAVRCLVTQRLLPRLCDCATAAPPDETLLAALRLTSADIAGWELRRPVGCANCDQTGRAGRIGVIQVTPVTAALQELAMDNAPAPGFERRLRELGIPTLHALALGKARQGLVCLDDIVRILGAEQ